MASEHAHVMFSKRNICLIVFILVSLQAVQFLTIVHRESLTWDEGDHMFAAYMMWHTGDYGLNPEHPPLVKLLAATPLLGRDLWVPPLQNRDFKVEAYLSGRDWIARNDGGRNHLVFQMRLAAGLLAIAFSLTVFFVARDWFGPAAGIVALILIVFDPNVLAHSALVTTDIGVSLFFLASIHAFYRYVKQPSITRLCLAGVLSGLLLATKHSGILLAPMLVLLIAWEVWAAPSGMRGRTGKRLFGAFAVIVVIGVVVLWAFYGFRYAARPAGLAMSTTLAEYVQPLSHFNAAGVMAIAHLHLLPESYLIGLVDVKRMSQDYPTFIFGKVYSHGVWWYFPVAILIKTTLGLLALTGLSLFAILSGRLKRRRELIYTLLPAAFYLAVAMLAGMNIGARHVLPVYTFVFALAGAGAAAVAAQSRLWAMLVAVLVLAHIISSLMVFPNPMAYANEAWGGPKNVHNLLSDANADWAQQLLSVKRWQDRHPGEECWFSYFADGVINPEMYGIRCHHLPNLATAWVGGADIIPREVSGNVLISAGDLSGCEWPSGRLNPVRDFADRRPDEMIDYGVFVYRGTFQLKQAAAVSRAQRARQLLQQGNATEALAMAREAVEIDPAEISSQTVLGDAAVKLGQKDVARAAWQAALILAFQLEPDAQANYVPGLQDKLKAIQA
jgi:4-amino-4-deoxy-L-arabinose transferase-like glycosyltransferase